MIKLGFFVKDRVTGLEGVAENRATFLYGCDRYFVQPKMDSDGKIPDGRMIDEPQLEILPAMSPVMDPVAEPEQVVTLGMAVYDPITDRKGTATGRAVYLNGCSRILVEPKHTLLNQDPKVWWVDEQQLEVGKKVVHKPEQAKHKTGGPARSCSKYQRITPAISAGTNLEDKLMRVLGILITFVAMVGSNYFYQWRFAETQDYLKAFDRSFFQGVAILILAVAGHFNREAAQISE